MQVRGAVRFGRGRRHEGAPGAAVDVEAAVEPVAEILCVFEDLSGGADMSRATLEDRGHEGRRGVPPGA